MQSFINLPKLTSDLTEMKTLYDGMENYIRGLESMGKTFEAHGSPRHFE